MVVPGDLNATVGNEFIEGIVGQHGVMECQGEMKVANDYWTYVQSRR